MASNPAAPEAPFVPSQRSGETEAGKIPTFGLGGKRTDEGPWEEWNPTADSTRPVRGRHRVSKQRGGGLARSSTVLGVGVIAAVGAGGMATAQTGKPPGLHLHPRPRRNPSTPSPFPERLGRRRPRAPRTALSSVGVTAERDRAGHHRRRRGPARPHHPAGRAAAGPGRGRGPAGRPGRRREEGRRRGRQGEARGRREGRRREEEGRGGGRGEGGGRAPRQARQAATRCRPPRTRSPRPSARPARCGPPATTPAWTSPLPPVRRSRPCTAARSRRPAGPARTATARSSSSTTAPSSGTPTSRRSTSASARRSPPATSSAASAPPATSPAPHLHLEVHTALGQRRHRPDGLAAQQGPQPVDTDRLSPRSLRPR